MLKQRGSESGKEAMKVVEWKAQRKSEAKAEDKGEPEEAAAEIEAGGRRKEIADEIGRASCRERVCLSV